MSTSAPGRPPRYTIDLDLTARARLNELARDYRLTQGEIIEVLLAETASLRPEHALAIALTNKREAKVASRAQARELVAKLRALPPELVAKLRALPPEQVDLVMRSMESGMSI